MYRGRKKRLPEPTSEFSLNNIKSDDGNSINKESDNCHKRVKPFHNSQSETLDETSRLISENSGYVSICNQISRAMIKRYHANIE